MLSAEKDDKCSYFFLCDVQEHLRLLLLLWISIKERAHQLITEGSSKDDIIKEFEALFNRNPEKYRYVKSRDFFSGDSRDWSKSSANPN